MATKKQNGVQGDDLVNFEKGRIKQLQEERLHIQKKTFTKWMNSFLLKARLEVEDLFKDLADGRKLLKLLEIISGEKLGKANNGKMRVHHVENVNKSLAFLHTKVRLESIGAEDIVDGNPRLILGLIWTIILRFQIQEIEIDVDEDNHESSEKKSAKDALLLWCQRKTNGYPNVNILDFTGSWRSGLGFNALIHAHRPDLINFSQLVPTKHIENLNNAFDTAENGLGIPRLLDAEDIDCPRPDEKSILTYVASYYHTFARMKSELKGGRRIANIVGQIMSTSSLKESYESSTSTLLQWIQTTTTTFNNTKIPNSLPLIKSQLVQFKDYRTKEKPPKYAEKSEIEANYFNINIMLKELNQGVYCPPDGKFVHDIEKHWDLLEKSENRLESRLKTELLRQTQLEQVAIKFFKKADLRSGYLKDMIGVLSDPRYGINQGMVEATLKKHEAISADIMAREERVGQLGEMAGFLEKEGWCGAGEVTSKSTQIHTTWTHLLSLLTTHHTNLTSYNTLNLRKLEISQVTMETEQFQFTKSSRNLLECTDLLHHLHLTDVQLANIGETAARLEKLVAKENDEELNILVKKMREGYGDVVRRAREYRIKLEEELGYFQAKGDLEEELEWVEDKRRLVGGLGRGVRDLRGVWRGRGKLKTLSEETRAHSTHQNKLLSTLQDHPTLPTLPLTSKIALLLQEIKSKEEKLIQMEKTLTSFQDCNEICDLINEKRPLVESTDYGNDVPSATALLGRHKDLVLEIEGFKGEVEGLNWEGQEQGEEEESPDDEIWSEETRLVPQEYYDEETIERTEYQTVTEERPVAQVRALYPFNGQDQLDVAKGEVMFLLSKTNGDWWNVRKSNGVDGFVPANYVKEIEPKLVLVQVRKPEVIQETRRVKKTRMVMQSFNIKKLKPSSSAPESRKNLEARVAQVVAAYWEVVELAKTRTTSLTTSILLHTYLTEADDFIRYLTTQTATLTTPPDPSTPITELKKKFDQLFTSLSSSQKRLENLDAMAAKLSSPAVKPRQKQVHKLYDELQKLKIEKERSLAGASIVELFHSNCGELEEWILEKMDQMEGGVGVWTDLKTVQALQRRHLNIERELEPIRERLERVKGLATSASTSYPLETPKITTSLSHLTTLFTSLISLAATKRATLDTAVGKEIFSNSSKQLTEFCKTMQAQFSTTPPIKDVSTAEDQIKHHEQLLDELKNKEDEYLQTIDLGKKLSLPTDDLQALFTSLPLHHSQKQSLLSQIHHLRIFEKEADSIERQIPPPTEKSLGNNLEQVVFLLKQHDTHENQLAATEERVERFLATAEKLEKTNDTDIVKERKERVVKLRNKLKTNASTRKSSLLASLRFHEFATELDDMLVWVQEKKSHMTDDYKDLANLQKKLKKHLVFSGELRSNESKLKSINRAGEKLIKEENNPNEVKSLLAKLNANWSELAELCSERYKNLKEAEQTSSYNKDVEEVGKKLLELEGELGNKDLGKDRRGCKELLKRHGVVEGEIESLGRKIDALVKHGQELKAEGHYDGDRILKEALELKKALDKLREPARRRRAALEELLTFYDFLFELEGEQAYIREKSSILSLTTLPNSHHDATISTKKLAKFLTELTNHTPTIEKVLNLGASMSNHPERVRIAQVCQELRSEWEDLLNEAEEKRKRLEFSLKAWEFYSDVGEVEAWIGEKRTLLTTPNLGTTASASVQLLTKHKQLELEIDTYSSLIQESHLISKSNPDYDTMVAKQKEIQEQMEELKKLANRRRSRLIEAMNRHEFYAESSDLTQWIDDLITSCSSEDYGLDFEHLERIKSKFLETCKNKIKAGEKRLEALDALVGRIVDGEDGEREEAEKEVEAVGDITRVHSEVCTRWNYLLELSQARELKLLAAGEIHRFNRDVADALERINEKLSEIPEDTGKDYNSCEMLLRNMENFESDLVPLEAQLQVLIDDATRLSTLYPTNAPNISTERDLVIASWTQLQEKTNSKKSTLHSNLAHHKFTSIHRDLTNFNSNILKHLEKLPTTDAQLLSNEHEQLLIEITSRHPKYDEAAALAAILDPKTHPEVPEKLESLKLQKAAVQQAWTRKKTYLDQLLDLQLYYREIHVLQGILNSQETILNQEDTTTTVEEVEEKLKSHSDLQNLINKQEHKFDMAEGRKLIEQGHFEKDKVKKTMDEVKSKRGVVVKLAEEKRKKLEGKLAYLKFVRDVTEALTYLDEKEKQLSNLNKSTLNLEEKIKKLKKHQAFEAELRRGNIPTVIAQAKEIDKDLHGKLLEKWSNLLKLSGDCGKDLEEARDILEFQNEVEKLSQFLREREALVLANDLGIDYEHCIDLIKRLENQTDDGGIGRLNELGARLGTDESVKDTLERVNKRWVGLKEGLGKYREGLEKSLEIHRLNKELDDLNLRIKEKIPSVTQEDLGRDLDSVNSLLRKQDQVENEMKLMSRRLTELSQIQQSLPNVSLDKITSSWATLTKLCAKRRNDLNDSKSYQEFLKELFELETFVEREVGKLSNGRMPGSLVEAEELIQAHSSHTSTLTHKLTSLSTLSTSLANAISQNHTHSSDLQNCITTAESLQNRLTAAISTRDQLLSQGVSLQHYNKLTTTTNNYLNELDSICRYHLGNELPMVIKMMQLHQESNSLLAKCQEKVVETTTTAENLSKNHYDSERILEKAATIQTRFNELKTTHKTKSKSLSDTHDYLKFTESLSAIEQYLQNCLSTASEDNYSDMTNLQSKMQKHQAFIQEMSANEGRITSITNVGQELVSKKNLHSDEITTQLSNLQELVLLVKTTANKKRDRLYESYQALLFFNNLDDLESFLDEQNFGETSENLAACKGLLKKWSLIREGWVGKREVKENIVKQNAIFQKGHFLKEEINERVGVVLGKYDDFEGRVGEKLEQLTVDLERFEFLRDVGDLSSYLTEKQHQLTHLQTPTSLEQVHHLTKKLSQITQELTTTTPAITQLNHPPLTEQLATLNTCLKEKQVLLSQSLLSQQLYADMNEAHLAIKEKSDIFSSSDTGTDEESISKLQKKFENNSLTPFETIVQGLLDRAGKLENNFDSERIKSEVERLKESFSALQLLSDKRRQRLEDAGKLFRFMRASSEVIEWIEVQMHTAGSEDYGRDVEHVEILIQKFETFLGSILISGENRVSQLDLDLKTLVEVGGHPEESVIRGRVLEVKGVWEEFKELAGARVEALEGAKRVHMFDRTADETISWINEKHVSLPDDLKIGKKLVELELEEKALKEQVESVKADAEELSGLFPDAEEHVQSKLSDLLETFSNYTTKLATTKERLVALEAIQDYYLTHSHLLSHLTSIHAQLTSITISTPDIEQSQHNLTLLTDLLSSYKARTPDLNAFTAKGQNLIDSGHFLSMEISQKIQSLQEKRQILEEAFSSRRILLEENADLQKFYQDLLNFEALLKTKQSQVSEDKEIESISQIEQVLREFDDVEVFLGVVDEKVGVVERLTLIEKKEEEERLKMKELEEERKKREGMEAVKRSEIERIKGERSGSGGLGIFGDVLRRDPLPRSSSFRATPTTTNTTEKKPKRTPSFTTRRRTQSFRKVKQIEDATNLPPITIDGYLERKHEFISVNKRATNRSWKSYYTVLCGQLLCFFRDQVDFVEGRNAASSPVNIYNCSVEEAKDYVKKRFVFRVRIFDGGEYLFACENETVLSEWVDKLSTVGKLEPREQLMEKAKEFEPDRGHDGDQSSSEDEVRLLKNKPRSREPLYANMSSMLEEPHHHHRNKPPIPPRSSSILGNGSNDNIDNGNDVYQATSSSTLPHNNPQQQHQQQDLMPRSSGSLPSKQQQSHHDSSSESDSPKSGQGNKQQKRSSSGLMGLFKRKRATQL